MVPQRVHVICETEVFRPVGKVDIPEHRTLDILILDDDLPSSSIPSVAEQGGSYDFLHHAGEDIYAADDGEAV